MLPLMMMHSRATHTACVRVLAFRERACHRNTQNPKLVVCTKYARHDTTHDKMQHQRYASPYRATYLHLLQCRLPPECLPRRSASHPAPQTSSFFHHKYTDSAHCVVSHDMRASQHTHIHTRTCTFCFMGYSRTHTQIIRRACACTCERAYTQRKRMHARIALTTLYCLFAAASDGLCTAAAVAVVALS